ncbi:MAG TPA: CrcB family protein, partial [Planctomycetota bacterium]|nr:CrcB family protein [Planctomycetota bacterium]
IGLIATLADERGRLGPDLRLFLVGGLLGGFTTFSAFGLEARAMGATAVAAAYVTLSLALGLGAVWLGGGLSR